MAGMKWSMIGTHIAYGSSILLMHPWQTYFYEITIQLPGMKSKGYKTAYTLCLELCILIHSKSYWLCCYNVLGAANKEIA